MYQSINGRAYAQFDSRPERLWDDADNVRGLEDYLVKKIADAASTPPRRILRNEADLDAWVAEVRTAVIEKLPNGHGKYVAPDDKTHHARFPLSSSLPVGERDKVSLREFHVNGKVQL